YGAVMVEKAAALAAIWRGGAKLDISEEMMGLTLSIVGKTLFFTDVASGTPGIGEARSESIPMMNWVKLPFSKRLGPLLVPLTRRFQRAKQRLDTTVYRMIREHRESGQDRGDLLSMLLMAQDELGDGEGMTDEQVRDEAMTLFLAGHETTSNALTWTWYL